jgi:long-chain acyl-CoA synthetase
LTEAAARHAPATEPIPFDALSYLEANAHHRRDELAVYDHGEQLSFGRLLIAVHALIGDVAERGIGPGDVVAVALPNIWRYVALEIAIPALGATILPLPMRLGQREVASALRRSGAVLVITDEQAPDSVVAGTARQVPGVQVVDAAALNVERRGVPATYARGAADPDRIVQIALTSGTTGLPKLASLSARLKQLTFEGFTARLGIAPGDRMLPMSPITQGAGEMCLYALRTGAALVMSHAPRFDPDAILALIERSGTTILGGVPTMIGRLVHARGLGRTDLRTLRATISAGAPLPSAVAEQWERLSGSSTCSFYGAMDIGQLAVPRPGDPAAKRWTTVGQPHDTAEWMICGPDGGPLPPGETGEICMRGPLVQDRYWGETTGPYGTDGWAHFGDLGFVDEDGFVHITGRLKDTIIRGGNNINPLEVEQLLRQHPAVRDACLIGRPDPDLGERAAAFVVCAPGSTFDLTRAVTFLEGQGLARYKWPETLITLENLPVGSTGKVDRTTLRRMLTEPADGGRPDAPQ